MKRKILIFSVAIAALWPVGRERLKHGHELIIDAKSRTIQWYNAVKDSKSYQVIRGPEVYINCDPGIKRHFKGRLVFEDGQPAKFFPIMDITTMKVWHTDKLGYFEFDFPGGCAMSIGTWGTRPHAVVFKFIKKDTVNIDEEYKIFQDSYVLHIGEDIPDHWIQASLLAGYEEYSTWPPKDPLTCVEGKTPDKVADFHPFLLSKDDKILFSGIEVQGKFSFRVLLNKPFRFLGYANKPKGRVTLFANVTGENRSPNHKEYEKPCYELKINELAELSYDDLRNKAYIAELLKKIP